MLDYRLQVFQQVAQHQNLTRAARSLHISQPAVTQHVKALEEVYQTALFVRSATGVTLTPAGLTLLDYAHRVGELHGEVMHQLSSQTGHFSGQLRLGASTTITQYLLPEILVALKRKYPAVEIEVTEGNSDAIISSLLARRIDLGLIESPCHRRDLRVQAFHEDEIIVVASSRHRLGQKSIVTLKELVREPVIFREVGSGTRTSVETELRKHQVVVADLQILQEIPSTEAIKRMVAAGDGIGFVSELSVTGEIASGLLKRIKVRGLNIKRAFSSILALGPDPVGLRQLLLSYLMALPARGTGRK